MSFKNYILTVYAKFKYIYNIYIYIMYIDIIYIMYNIYTVIQ